jgi:hypothetical protein
VVSAPAPLSGVHWLLLVGNLALSSRPCWRRVARRLLLSQAKFRSGGKLMVAKETTHAGRRETRELSARYRAFRRAPDWNLQGEGCKVRHQSRQLA